jgi:hypothetical protein
MGFLIPRVIRRWIGRGSAPSCFTASFNPTNLRTQYAAQYNFTIQRQFRDDWLLQIGYVGSQGHRLLAAHDLNYSQPQTCLDINAVLGEDTCSPFGEDIAYTIPAGAIPAGFTFHLPYGSVPTVTGPNANPITLVGLRRYSSPFCEPTTGAGCPPDGNTTDGEEFGRVKRIRDPRLIHFALKLVF